MKIRPLTPDDAGAYLAYRCEMWPANSAAGDWETVCIKYFQNPLARLCSGSGLYGCCFEGESLVGVWGAYRVNAVAPGFINTNMIRQLPEKKFAERVASIKMGRIGEPQDVANAILFLASDLSSYITGQIVGVDGGMLI